MDKRRARELLSLYRPGTLDGLDPQVAEALQASQQDPELAEWFNQQCGVCIALRSKLKQIEVPPDLKRKILLGNIGRRRTITLPRRGPLLAWAAAIALSGVCLWLFFKPNVESRFSAYLDRAAGAAARGYQMTLLSTNLEEIHAFLDQRKWPADYLLPKAIEKLPPEGCANLVWHNKKYSMLCFATGKNSEGKTRELYLLVADRTDFKNPPASEKPQIERVHENLILTASWVRGKNVYVLVGNREPDLLQFLD